VRLNSEILLFDTYKMKEPPDKSNFRTVKVPLKKILKHYDTVYPRFENAILRVNKFATLGYEFIKLYSLSKFENGEELPKINKSFITKIFSLIGQRSSKGRKCSTKNNDLTMFYNDIFSKICPDKINFTHLSYVLPVLSDEMVRCFETNIKTHFMKYLNRYINLLIRKPLVDGVKNSNLSREERKPLYQEINKKIRNIKNDLVNMKCEKSDTEHHQWITEQISLLFPHKITKSIPYDIKAHPQKYIRTAIIINQKIEELGMKPYQVFCQRSNLVPKAITLNTSGVIEVINDKKKEIYKYGYSEMNNNAKRYQNHTWKEILKLENKQIFNHKDYIFYNQIQTDGISANILFIRKDFYNKKYGQKLPTYDEDLELDIKCLNKLTKDECKNYQTKTLIGCDPGKKDIITMVNRNGKYYSYSNCRRRVETYTKRSNQIVLHEKQNNGIIELETGLSGCSKRTLTSSKYIECLKQKHNHLEELQNFYENPLFRKLKLRRYCRTKSSEDRMLNEIEKQYGKDLLIGLGDWSLNTSHQMKGCMPTPNKGITKILKKRFDVVGVDEFRTSKLYYKDTTQELTNLKVKRGKQSRSIHTLLTLTRNPNGVIMNRDCNASQNILNILREYIFNRKRPIEFCRGTKMVDL